MLQIHCECCLMGPNYLKEDETLACSSTFKSQSLRPNQVFFFGRSRQAQVHMNLFQRSKQQFLCKQETSAGLLLLDDCVLCLYKS